MLKAIPAGWFSWDFNIFDDDRKLALIDLAWTREAGIVVLDGATWKVYRKGLFSGPFILEKDGSVVASATKPSAWKRTMAIEYGNKYFTLKPESSLGRSFVLLDGETPIGAMRPVNFLTRKATIDFPDSIPLPVRIFMVWLVIVLWKRESDSAAAGGA